MNYKNKLYFLFDVTVVCLQIALFVLILVTKKDMSKLEMGTSSILLSVYVIVWGILFLLSYYQHEKSYVLRFLFWLCKISIGSKNGKIAFFYFWVAILASVIGFLYGLGIIVQ